MEEAMLAEAKLWYALYDLL